jgi:hypothetical protein
MRLSTSSRTSSTWPSSKSRIRAPRSPTQTSFHWMHNWLWTRGLSSTATRMICSKHSWLSRTSKWSRQWQHSSECQSCQRSFLSWRTLRLNEWSKFWPVSLRAKRRRILLKCLICCSSRWDWTFLLMWSVRSMGWTRTVRRDCNQSSSHSLKKSSNLARNNWVNINKNCKFTFKKPKNKVRNRSFKKK